LSAKPTLHHFGTLIQTDAKLNWGTSGGALINLKGEMVGLTTAVAAVAGFEQAAGYAVPVDETFRRAVETLKAGREVEYGFLGVKPMELTAERQLRGEHGALIQEVVPGTPADRANLRAEDIVVAVDGETIHDVDGLMLEVGKLAADTEVRLAVQRDGRLVQLIPRLAKYPVEGRKIVTTPLPDWRGMEVDYVTAQRGALSFPRLNSGLVVVTKVETESPAFKAGVAEGMRVTHVGGTAVRTPKEFFAAVADRTDGVDLSVWSPPDTRSVKHVSADIE
jgi:serine protease Do